MNAHEVFEKYKHLDSLIEGLKGNDTPFESYLLKDLWSAVKHEAIGQMDVKEVKIDGEIIYPKGNRP